MLNIPKKPDHRFVFVSNIKDPLAEELNPYPELMEAFLLSETYSTPKTINLTAKAKGIGSLIISDNGNFSRMNTLAGRFMEKGTAVLAKAKTDMLVNKQVSVETMKERQALLLEIEETVKAEQQKLDMNKIIGRQLACSPDYLIGMEDFTIPVLHMTGLLDPIFLSKPKLVKPFQKVTQDIYLNEKKGVFGFQNQLDEKLNFLVYHAHDYASARQASILNKKIEPDGIAISFGAPLASRNFIPSIQIGNKSHQFSTNLPESYLLCIALVLGATGGDKRSLPVHILGLGTPIMIILMSSLLKQSKAVSIDSTSTFKDADDGNLYGNRNAYLKMDMYKVAAYSLVNDDPYQSSSPWHSWFDAQYPSDWKGLQLVLNVKPGDDVNDLANKLKSNPALLEKYIPFFSPMRAGKDVFIKKVRIARTGANYWVLKRICEEVRLRIGNSKDLNKWVESEVIRYEKFASPKWAAAVRYCFEIIKHHTK